MLICHLKSTVFYTFFAFIIKDKMDKGEMYIGG